MYITPTDSIIPNKLIPLQQPVRLRLEHHQRPRSLALNLP